MRKLALILVVIMSTFGCASLKEISDEYPILTHIVLSNAVSQRIEGASDPQAKAAQYMAGVSRFRGTPTGLPRELPFESLEEIVRIQLDYKDMTPADRKALDDILLLTKLVITKELSKRGFETIPADYKVDISAILDAIEAGARVYLP